MSLLSPACHTAVSGGADKVEGVRPAAHISKTRLLLLLKTRLLLLFLCLLMLSCPEPAAAAFFHAVVCAL